jgi:hypothetical protein
LLECVGFVGVEHSDHVDHGRVPRAFLDVQLEGKLGEHMAVALDEAAPHLNARVVRLHAFAGDVLLFAVVEIASDLRQCGRLTGNDGLDAPEWKNAVGWFVSLIPLEIDLAGADRFDDVLASAHKAFRTGLTAADLPIGSLFMHLGSQYLPLTGFFDLKPQTHFSYTDYRKLPGGSRFDDWRQTTIRASNTSDARTWYFRTPEGVFMFNNFIDRPEPAKCSPPSKTASGVSSRESSRRLFAKCWSPNGSRKPTSKRKKWPDATPPALHVLSPN